MREPLDDNVSDGMARDTLDWLMKEALRVNAIEFSDHAAERWPRSTEIAAARVTALAGAGLKLAAGEAFAALYARSDADLENIVEASAAIEGQTRGREEEKAMVAALERHGAAVPECALSEAEALDRAMQCAVDTAREYGAYADGPLRWLEAPKGADPGWTPTLMIPMLGNARGAVRMNEALADALARDSEAMTASINHLMVVFIAGKTRVIATAGRE